VALVNCAIRRHEPGCVNSSCNFGTLVKLLDNQLKLDKKLKVLFHLEACDICRDAIYHITCDRDEARYNTPVGERTNLPRSSGANYANP
jgi:hypothetical protein